MMYSQSMRWSGVGGEEAVVGERGRAATCDVTTPDAGEETGQEAVRERVRGRRTVEGRRGGTGRRG